MLKINIVCAGKADKMFAAAIEEYLKRARTFFNLEIDEVSDEAVRSEGEVARAVAKESAALLARARGHIILLDIGGKAYGSAEIARKLESLSLTNPTVSFVIGGSYGVSAELKAAADLTLSLGAPTYPHSLVRVMLLEQIYRAGTILNGRTYHK